MIFVQINISNAIQDESYSQCCPSGKTIMETIMPDYSEQEKQSETILDYLYTSFQQTFHGIKQMLGKRAKLSEFEKVESAIEDLLVVISDRKLTEFAESAAKSRLTKKTMEMIEHLQSINQMCLPRLKTKNIISNERNVIL